MIFKSSKTKSAKDGRHKYRRFLSQFAATTVKNMLMMDLGFSISIPTIIVAALTGIQNEHNRNEFLTITSVQASWLGALGFMTKPFGSFISGILSDTFGRKRTMIFVNIPFAIGWYTLHQASKVWHVFTGFGLVGLSVGLMEASVVTFVGEISEPSFRGLLVGYTYFCYTFGMFLVILLNTFMAWRTVCLVCFMLPVITVIALFFIPETPQWLLSKNRNVDAERSLRWLRGWVSSEAVATEFKYLQRHCDQFKSCNECIKNNMKCTHPLPTIREKFADLQRKRTLKPLLILFSLFILAQYPGTYSMRPYLMQIFKAYDSPIPADKALRIMSFLDLIGSVSFMCLVRFTGKRKLYLFCMCGALICSSTLTWFGFTYLPSGYVSFDQAHREPFHLENRNLGYIPIICLLAWSYFAICSLATLPLMFLSELFPFKTRGIGNGIAATFYYMCTFFTIKTYYSLETTLSLPGVSLFYVLTSLLGLILAYKLLPETENRSLEDIELHFSDNSKGFFDRKIFISEGVVKHEHNENENSSEIISY